MKGSPDIELLTGGSYKSRHSACLGDVAVHTNTVWLKMVAGETLANSVNPEQFTKILLIQIYIIKLQVQTPRQIK